MARRSVVPVVIAVGTVGVTAWMFRDGARWTEYLGFLTGVACVWLFIRNRVASWPVGLANSALLFWVFWDAHLFADMWLQAVYLALGVTGWWMWIRYRGTRVERPTRHATGTDLAGTTAAVLAGWAVMYWYFATFTSAAAPLWDSLLTAGSLGAQYLLMRRLVENWWFWIAVDVGYVALFWARDLHITSVLYLVFLVMAIDGLAEWRLQLRDRDPMVVAVP